MPGMFFFLADFRRENFRLAQINRIIWLPALPAIAFFEHLNVVEVLAEAGCWVLSFFSQISADGNPQINAEADLQRLQILKLSHPASCVLRLF